MFLKYFKLVEQPFGATPDPRFLFHSNSHREALASLYCAFYANRGFAALIAEPGMGKTTLLFDFLEHIKECAKTVFLFNTFCGPDDIVTYILRDSGVEPGPPEMYISRPHPLGSEGEALIESTFPWLRTGRAIPDDADGVVLSHPTSTVKLLAWNRLPAKIMFLKLVIEQIRS